MDQTFVIVDGNGDEHEFPVSMDPKRAAAIVRGEDVGGPHKTASAEDYYQPSVFQQPVSASVKQGLTGAVKGGAEMIPGIVNFVKDAVTTLGTKNVEDAGHQMQATAAKADEGNKSVPERILYDVMSRVPVVGPAIVSAGEKLGSGNPEMMGKGALETGMLVEGASPAMRGATKAGATKVGSAAARVPGVSKVAGAVKEAASNPGTAALGAYEGYHLLGGGMPGVAGAVGGALGLPLGKAEIFKRISSLIKEAQGAKTAAPTAPAPAPAPAKPAVDPMAGKMSGAPSLEDLLKQRATAPEPVVAESPVSATTVPVRKNGEVLKKEPMSPIMQQISEDIAKQDAALKGTPADVPNNPTAQALEAERKAAEAAHLAKQTAPPEPTLPHSQSKTARGAEARMSTNDRKVFADNIRNGMSEEDAMADMLKQRAERAKSNYSNAKDQAAARRMDLGGEGLSSEQLRTMLLDALKRRNGTHP